MAPENKGAFQGRGSANYVARCLGLGGATVYKFIKELRNRTMKNLSRRKESVSFHIVGSEGDSVEPNQVVKAGV